MVVRLCFSFLFKIIPQNNTTIIINKTIILYDNLFIKYITSTLYYIFNIFFRYSFFSFQTIYAIIMNEKVLPFENILKRSRYEKKQFFVFIDSCIWISPIWLRKRTAGRG